MKDSYDYNHNKKNDAVANDSSSPKSQQENNFVDKSPEAIQMRQFQSAIDSNNTVSQLQKDEDTQDGQNEQVEQLQSTEILCSMAPDGKIGSVYFEDSRIRTTHAEGPVLEYHDENWTRLQFNIIESEASVQFSAQNPGKDSATHFADFTSFLTQNLINCNADNAPQWATLVGSVDDALDLKEGPMSDDQKLFEIFKTAKGNSAAKHLSRGGAVKLAVDSNVVQVLKDAINHVIYMQFKTYDEDNEAFYNYIAEHAPDFAKKLRKHDEIDYDG